MPFELSDQEKAQILQNRGKQFAAEKFNHEVNLSLLQASASDDSTATQIEQTNAAIATLADALANVDALLSDVEPDAPTPKSSKNKG